MTQNKGTNEQLVDALTRSKHWYSFLEKHEIDLEGANKLFEKNSMFLGLFINLLPHPFYVIDAKNYIIKAANSAAQFGRLTKESTCYALAHNNNKPCHSNDHPCPLELIKKHKQPVTVEHRHINKEGISKYVEVHAFPIFDVKGNVSNIIEFVIDIN